jgi:hypothetical protein
VWLLTNQEEPFQIRESAVQFINRERSEFQAECHLMNRIFFADGSGVNSWVALWGDDMTLNYRGYDQG